MIILRLESDYDEDAGVCEYDEYVLEEDEILCVKYEVYDYNEETDVREEYENTKIFHYCGRKLYIYIEKDGRWFIEDSIEIFDKYFTECEKSHIKEFSIINMKELAKMEFKAKESESYERVY